MAFAHAGLIEALPPGSVMEATIEDRTVAICNVGGELHAVDGVCPHRGGPLGQGALHDDTLACPWHCWEYDVRSGELRFNPAVRLQRFAVKLEGDNILVDVSAGTS